MQTAEALLEIIHERETGTAGSGRGPLKKDHQDTSPAAHRYRSGRALGMYREEGMVVHTGDVADSGVVREFHADEGWGVIDGPAVPGGCWVHFSAIAMSGLRQLAAGQHVWFRAETAEQDGFRFRAVKAWTEDVEPASPPRSELRSGGAHQSRLVLMFDEPEEASEFDNE